MIGLGASNIWAPFSSDPFVGMDYATAIQWWANNGPIPQVSLPNALPSAGVVNNFNSQAMFGTLWQNHEASIQGNGLTTVAPPLLNFSQFYDGAPLTPSQQTQLQQSLVYQTPAPKPAVQPVASSVQATQASSAQSGKGNMAVLTFQNLTGNNNGVLNIGDKWAIQITGASPNSPVSVTGGMNGGMATTPMGVTDGSGNFSLTGNIDSGQIGSWNEIWNVGNAQVGSFQFSVAAASNPATTNSTAGANYGTNNSTVSSSGSQAVNTGSTLISSIPYVSSIESLINTQVFGMPLWVFAIGGFMLAKVLEGGK